jgi:hypothetical protein
MQSILSIHKNFFFSPLAHETGSYKHHSNYIMIIIYDNTPSKMFQSLPHSPHIKSLVLGGLGIKNEVHTQTTCTSILLQYSDHSFATINNTAQGPHSAWDSLRVTYDSSQGISEVQIRFNTYTGGYVGQVGHNKSTVLYFFLWKGNVNHQLGSGLLCTRQKSISSYESRVYI